MNLPSLLCRGKAEKENAIALQHTSSRFLKSVLVLRIETARVKGRADEGKAEKREQRRRMFVGHRVEQGDGAAWNETHLSRPRAGRTRSA